LPNHGFTLQTNGQVLPVLYYDQQSGPSTPVVFQVDLSVEVLLGNFNPASDFVEARGTFQAGVWSGGFALTNNPLAANPYLYSGTAVDQHEPGTVEAYKFVVDDGNNLGWEAPLSTGGNDRTFSLAATTQTLPAVYFNDIASAIPVTFQVDLGPQISSGNFNSANGDVIEVRGSINGWYGGSILTNVPGTSLYQNTWMDTTDPVGGLLQYKYFIAHAGNDSDPTGYEVLANNRTFPLTGNSVILPLAYYNDQAPSSGGARNTVTFRVDMSLPIALGTFQPASGDIVSAAGTFQSPNQWASQVFPLTASGVGNIYVGTYANDGNYPSSLEEYKFVITSGGSDNWETLPNREFTLTNGEVLPVVYFNNQAPGNSLLQGTSVTFTVNMTNAVDIFGNPFDPARDLVMIDGDFTSPQWPVMSHAGDPSISSDYQNNVLQQSPSGSLLYSGTFNVPAGNPVQVTYKYGIYHNAGSVNTNVDNEAVFGQNHSRFIRSGGSYNFPVDTFGVMLSEALVSQVVKPDDTLGLRTAVNPNGDQLTFSLAAGAPAGASINPATGVFSWHPGRAYASTVNYITVNITDATVPALSTAETLVVRVLDYLDLTVGSAALLAGQSGGVPISLASSEGVTNVVFNLAWPGGRLLNPALTSVPASAAGVLQNQTTNLLIQVWALPGQVLTGTNQIALLTFQAAPNQISAILPIPTSGLAATKPGTVSYFNNLVHPSEVVVVGTTPLLRPNLSSSLSRSLDLFGNPGANYQLQYTTNLAAPDNWIPLLNYSQTNVQQSVDLDAANPVIFYRLLQP